jgi:WD40 repeat protein
MISPIRSLCFNDDRKTFTIVLPSQYRIYRADPFDIVFSRDCEDLSLGSVATHDGYRLVALTGAPSSPTFSTKSVRVFDHRTGQLAFDHTLSDHILTMRLAADTIVCAMHCKIEVWQTRTRTLLHTLTTGLNVHVPIALSPNASALIIAGTTGRHISLHKGVGGTLNSSTFTADETTISIVSFSDDSSLFATAAFNGNQIYVWDVRTVSHVAILDRGSGDHVQTIDFSPSNDHFAACSKEGTVRVWDIKRRVANAMKPTAQLCAVSIAPKVSMPRIAWLGASALGVTTLEGDFFKVKLAGANLEVEKTPFLKRDLQ